MAWPRICTRHSSQRRARVRQVLAGAVAVVSAEADSLAVASAAEAEAHFKTQGPAGEQAPSVQFRILISLRPKHCYPRAHCSPTRHCCPRARCYPRGHCCPTMRCCPTMHFFPTSVFSYLAIFGVIPSVAGQRTLNRFLHVVAILLPDALHKRFKIPRKRTRGLPVNPLHILRPLHLARKDIPIPTTKIGGFEAEPHSLFTFAQCHLHSPKLGHIPCNLGGAYHPSRSILHRRDG